MTLFNQRATHFDLLGSLVYIQQSSLSILYWTKFMQSSIEYMIWKLGHNSIELYGGPSMVRFLLYWEICEAGEGGTSAGIRRGRRPESWSQSITGFMVTLVTYMGACSVINNNADCHSCARIAKICNNFQQLTKR